MGGRLQKPRNFTPVGQKYTAPAGKPAPQAAPRSAIMLTAQALVTTFDAMAADVRDKRLRELEKNDPELYKAVLQCAKAQAAAATGAVQIGLTGKDAETNTQRAATEGFKSRSLIGLPPTQKR